MKEFIDDNGERKIRLEDKDRELIAALLDGKLPSELDIEFTAAALLLSTVLMDLRQYLSSADPASSEAAMIRTRLERVRRMAAEYGEAGNLSGELDGL